MYWGLTGWTMGLDALFGSRPPESVTDLNNDGVIDNSDTVSYGGANVNISGFAIA